MSIGTKLSIGFGVLVILTLLVVGLGYWGSEQATRKIDQTEQLRLPTVLASNRAQVNLLRMLSSTRGYLVLGDQKYRDDYDQARHAFETDLAVLETLRANWTNPQNTEHLQELKAAFETWSALPNQLFDLRDDQLRREPALRILMKEAQPFLLYIIRDTRRLIKTQGQREPSKENLALLEDMANFQASFYAIVAGLRSYVTTSRENFKFEYTANLALNEESLEKLLNQQDLLTSTQQETLDSILKKREAFLHLPEQIFQTIEGEHAREDLFLFRTEAIPLAETMLQLLDEMTIDQQKSLQTDLYSGTDGLAAARWQTLIGGVFAVILASGLAFLLRRNITDPVQRLTWVARQIQEGELTAQVQIESSDEIGTLARTFNSMTRKLIQTMDELTRAKESALEAQSTAEEAQRAAESANRAKSVFLANMSHELRTPLSAILGFAQLMAHGTRISHEYQENLSIIRRNGEHLLTLINQVLDLSKIEAGRTTLNPKNFDLHRLLDDMQDMFALRADNKHLQLLFERDKSVPQYVRTDEVKLRQVLINLLSNAMKFTEAGNISLRVYELNELDELPTQKLKNSKTQKLCFEISDTGPGIAPEEMDKVFEAFGQTETGRQMQEGTGLGLPISRKFVQLMGGDMYVESEVGHGTTFTFNIQVHVVDAAEIDAGCPTRQVIALEPEQPRYRMLIVDDRPDNRKLLVTLLNPFGFDLREAKNGQEAIEIWEEWEPHLIWMDMRMPVLDGYEATKAIRRAEEQKLDTGYSILDTGIEYPVSSIQQPASSIQHPATGIQHPASSIQHPVIIAVTASSYEEERAVVLSAGCDDFLRKPFKDAEIFEMLQKHLGIRFVYEERQQVAGSKAQVAGSKAQVADQNVLKVEALVALPVDWVTDLKKGAEEVDPELLSSVIKQIRGCDAALADALARLIEDFAYDEILSLIQEV